METERKISAREKFGYLIIDMTGTIDYDDMLRIDSLIKKTAKEEQQTILLNFKEVDFLNTSALTVLISMAKEMPKNNKDMQLLHVNGNIQNLLRMNNNLSFFTIIHNEDSLMLKKRNQELDSILDDPV